MSLFIQLKDFLLKCKRVWIVTRKPTNLEFKTIAKANPISSPFVPPNNCPAPSSNPVNNPNNITVLTWFFIIVMQLIQGI